MSEDLHVSPVNDSAPHESSPECWCRPEELSLDRPGFTLEGQAKLWVHHSADGRELAEAEKPA
jgi:hypothetical protein